MTTEELILDRLIEEVSRPMRIELAELRKQLSETRQTLKYREDALEREVSIRQKLQTDAREFDKPLTDFYHAADKVCHLNLSNAPRNDLREAISQMGDAMCVAESSRA